MRACAWVLTLALALPTAARAQTWGVPVIVPTAPVDGNTRDGSSTPVTLTPPRLIVPSAPVDAAQLARLQKKVRLARRLMPWHRALGLATLALLTVGNILGSLAYYDKYDARGSDNGRLAPWHEGVSLGATAAFAATGVVALLGRNPYPERLSLDRAGVHKLAMALAALGFVVELVLGPISSASDGKLYQRGLAVGHVVTGWVTLGFMSAGVLCYAF
jgi:hypothetical protein